MSHSSGLVGNQIHLEIFEADGYCFLHSGTGQFTALAAVNI